MAMKEPNESSSPYVVVLYGSIARGDHDSMSDRDILSIGKPPSESDWSESEDTSIVRYDWYEFSEMHSYGSLFLRHLRKDALIVSSNAEGKSRYVQMLDSLPAYARANHDIGAFRRAIVDCESALQLGDTSIEFELSSIATVMRHAAILGCYLAGEPEFGRYEPVRRFCLASHLPTEIAYEFAELYRFRLAIVRGVDMALRGSELYARLWSTRARVLVGEVANCASRQNLSRSR